MSTQPPPPPPSASYPPPPPPPPGTFTSTTTRAPYAPAAVVATPGAHLRQVLASLDQETLRPTVIVGGVIFSVWLVTQILGAIAPPAPVQTGGNGGNQGGGNGGQSAGGIYTIGGLKFGVLSGWQSGTNQAANGRLTNGVAYIDMFVYNFTGTPLELYNQYNAGQQNSSTGFNAGTAAPVAPNGLTGVRGTYFGVFSGAGNVDGEVTAVTVGGKGYVFDVWATGGLLNQSLPEADQMLSTLQLSQ